MANDKMLKRVFQRFIVHISPSPTGWECRQLLMLTLTFIAQAWWEGFLTPNLRWVATKPKEGLKGSPLTRNPPFNAALKSFSSGGTFTVDIETRSIFLLGQNMQLKVAIMLLTSWQLALLSLDPPISKPTQLNVQPPYGGLVWSWNGAQLHEKPSV